MTTLAIDTSTDHGSVAVARDAEIVFGEDFVADRSHSSVLFEILERARRECVTLDRIAIGLGPGSYAGIRISIAAALGLSLATGAELVGLPTPVALVTDEPRFVVIGDARRGTWYWTSVVEGVCREGPELLSEDELRARLRQNDLPVLASETMPPECGAVLAFPSARRLALNGRGITSRRDLEPIYLREPHITYSVKGVK